MLSDRVNKVDRRIIQDMLSNYYQIGNLGKQDVVNWLAEFGKITPEVNYFRDKDYLASVVNDPVFTEVRDRTSSNFLWFIKFERSFKEVEEELKQEKVVDTHECTMIEFKPNKKRGD